MEACWLIDHDAFDITVLDFASASQSAPRTFSGDDIVVSWVLPALNEKAAQFFN